MPFIRATPSPRLPRRPSASWPPSPRARAPGRPGRAPPCAASRGCRARRGGPRPGRPTRRRP
ncbi:hypothetical protein EPO15_09265 [bacterium]|nr:MAG: hypothetical protein EPO15_09265 [bacterium]